MSTDNTNTEDFSKMFFDAMDKLEKPATRNKSRTYSKFIDLCNTKTMGQVIGRAIADAKGRPVRAIFGYRDISYPDLNEDGTPTRKRFSWMESSNYVGITPDQRELNDKVGALLREVDNLKRDHADNKALSELWTSFRSRYFIMYMKVKKIKPSKGEEQRFDPYQTSLLTHRGANFGTALKSAIEQQTTNLDGTSWIEKCFSRDVENSRYVLNINTSRPKGYDINVSINETAEEVPLTPEDLDMTQDLTKELISDVFDEERLNKELKIMQGIIRELSNQPDLTTSLDKEEAAEYTEDADVPY